MNQLKFDYCEFNLSNPSDCHSNNFYNHQNCQFFIWKILLIQKNFIESMFFFQSFIIHFFLFQLLFQTSRLNVGFVFHSLIQLFNYLLIHFRFHFWFIRKMKLMKWISLLFCLWISSVNASIEIFTSLNDIDSCFLFNFSSFHLHFKMFRFLFNSSLVCFFTFGFNHSIKTFPSNNTFIGD